jgi:RNA polymerase sigma-70 factor (ECF subfamily)
MDLMAAAPALHSQSVRQVSAADRQQLDDLYRAHHQIIWRTLRRMGFSPEAAADHTQQAYLIALERLDRILPGSERAFLFSTAIFFGRTVLRKERRMELTDDVDAGSDEGASARGLDQRQVALQLLERILEGMDPDLVSVFTLYEIEGLSSPEIAELLSIPLGTVASRLRRARESFRSRAARVERGPAFVKGTSP